MAMLLLPLAFAGAGYLGFGSIGAAAGWLIGSWLFGPKANTGNDIFDPGAQEMPRWNQSLRGVTIPVLFGTNRVASNVVWVNNFQTIRKENQQQQAGGKGGGSGMSGGKGGGGGGTQISYEYKWDILFHIGMGPEPYGIFGAWVNTARMNSDTLLAIINNAVGMPPISNTGSKSVTYTVGGVTSQVQQSSNTASLTFDDSFLGTGGPTNDPGFPNWDYFETVTGSPCRWPYTYYVGFKALSLGSSPAVPQLSWEIGPGQAVITRTPVYLNSYPDYRNDNGTTDIVIGEDGNHYVAITTGNSNDLNVWCAETDTLQTKAYTSLPTGGGAGPSGARVLAGGGSPYFLHLGWGFPGGADVTINAILYKIDATGTLVVVDSYAYKQPGGQSYAMTLGNPVGFGFVSFDAIMSKSSGYPTWIIAHSVGGHSRVLLLSVPYQGTVTQGATAYPIFDDQNNSLNGLVIMNIQDNDGIASLPTGMVFGTKMRAFFLPEYHPENSPAITGNGKWPIEYQVCFYCNKAMIAADDGSSPTMTANKGANPNGFVVGWKLTGLSDTSVTVGPATVLNGSFVDQQSKALTAMFDDSGLRKDGTTTDQASDYGAPHLAVTDQGGIVLMFPKFFSQSGDWGTEGSYIKIKVFVYNPANYQAKFYTESEGAYYDQIVDLGNSSVFNWREMNIALCYDTTKQQLYVFTSIPSGPITIASIWGPMAIGGGQDVLPPYIIYQILTNPIFGMGRPTSAIDQTSYQLALQYCDAQGFRVSVQYTREQDVLSAIEDLLALYGGYLIDSGGTISFGIAKFTGTPVRVIDNHHLVPPKPGDPPVSVTKGALVDGYNKVRMNYFDRSLDYRQNQLEVGDEVDQDFNGIRFKEFPAIFVMSVNMAQAVIERALWTNLYARDTYKFMLGWKDADLQPGDVITLVDSFHPELAGGKNVRIAHWQEKSRGKFDIQAVLEVPYYMSASHATTPQNSAGIGKGNNDEVLPCKDFRMYELPREFQTANAYLYAGYNQQSNVRGATLWLSADGVTYAPANNAEPYIISGQFAQPLPAHSPGNVERNVEMYILTASGFSVSTPTYCQTLALDDVTPSARAAGFGVLICGSEALSMENLTLIGQNHYRIGKLYRGWGGTLTQVHNSGDLWHRHGSGILMSPISPDKIGTNIYYKVVPYNFAGTAYDVSSITGKLYSIRGAYWLPQEMPELSTFVQSPLAGTNSIDLRESVYKAVASGGCNVTLTWPDCARLEGFGQGGFGKSTFGHYLADLDSHSWRVEVMSGGTVVRSTSVASGPFTYTMAQNSADFAGFGKAFQLRVTPYNNYGDAPIASVKSLNLFW